MDCTPSPNRLGGRGGPQLSWWMGAPSHSVLVNGRWSASQLCTVHNKSPPAVHHGLFYDCVKCRDAGFSGRRAGRDVKSCGVYGPLRRKYD